MDVRSDVKYGQYLLTSAHVFSPSTTAIATPGTCQNSNVSLANFAKLSSKGLEAFSLNTCCCSTPKVGGTSCSRAKIKVRLGNILEIAMLRENHGYRS